METLLTTSGARMAMLSPDLARAFLDRHGPADYRPGPFDLAWGAFEDGGPLVGIGALRLIPPGRGQVWIAVAPERRRLGMGSELIGLGARAAQGRGLQYLACRYRVGDLAADGMMRSLGRPVGRRVDGGMVWTVAVLAPEARGGQR